MLLRLPESQLKTHLLMLVDKLKKWTDFRDEVVAISRVIAAAQSQPTPMDIGALCKWKGSKGAGKRNNPTQQACTFQVRKHGSHFCKLSSLTKRAENVERLVIWQVCRSSGTPQPKAKGGQKGEGGGKGANAV